MVFSPVRQAQDSKRAGPRLRFAFMFRPPDHGRTDQAKIRKKVGNYIDGDLLVTGGLGMNDVHSSQY